MNESLMTFGFALLNSGVLIAGTWWVFAKKVVPSLHMRYQDECGAEQALRDTERDLKASYFAEQAAGEEETRRLRQLQATLLFWQDASSMRDRQQEKERNLYKDHLQEQAIVRAQRTAEAAVQRIIFTEALQQAQTELHEQFKECGDKTERYTNAMLAMLHHERHR
jgi:hypothetical protein